MSFLELKEKVAALPPEEQAELAEFLSERLGRNDPEYRAELARLIDDPKHWVRWDEAKRDLTS